MTAPNAAAQTSNQDAVEKIGPGRLVLVVGPSGAGKDTLIKGAKAVLGGDADFVFVRRIVTRMADPDVEDHDMIDLEGFHERLLCGDFALSWQAHGYHYALPSSLNPAIRAGATVVANTSRTILTQAHDIYRNLRIIHVTAGLDVLAERLARRGREDAATIARRLSRATELEVTGTDVVTIDNSGPLETAAAAFLAAITA